MSTLLSLLFALGMLFLTLVYLPLVCWDKGKKIAALVGFIVPFVHIVCACRLAKPDSDWADDHYDGEKLEKSRKRFPDIGARQTALRDEMIRLYGRSG